MIGNIVKQGGSWRARCTVRGKRHDECFRSRKMAELYLKKLEVDRDLGKIDPNPAKPKLTFGQAVEHYRADARLRLAETTMASYSCRLDANLLPVLGDLQLVDLNPAAIESYISARLRGGATPNDVAHDRMLLGAIFTWCVNCDYVGSNPVRRTRKLKYSPTQIMRALSDAEIDRAVEVLSPASRFAFLFAVYTGARASEMCRVQWAHVHLEVPSVTILSLGRVHTKSYKGRDVPLHPVLLTEMATHRHRGKYLFAGATAEVHGRDFRGIIDQTVSEAKLERYRWHDLRHSFATRLRRAGVSLEDIAALLGHSSLQSTLIYAHADPRRLQESVGRMVAAGGPAAAAGSVKRVEKSK